MSDDSIDKIARDARQAGTDLLMGDPFEIVNKLKRAHRDIADRLVALQAQQAELVGYVDSYGYCCGDDRKTMMREKRGAWDKPVYSAPPDLEQRIAELKAEHLKSRADWWNNKMRKGVPKCKKCLAKAGREDAMSEPLKPCPCGTVPTNLILVGHSQGGKWAQATCDRCVEWSVEFCTDYFGLDTPECIENARKAWNDAPRAEKPSGEGE